MKTSLNQLLTDRRGVALPLALVGLVAVTLMVTTALVTSSTEVALSSAHQAGARVLYQADDALERFVAARANATPEAERLMDTNYSLSVDGTDFTISSALLRAGTPTVAADGSASRTDAHSLVAQPTDGRGRSVGALIQVTRMATPLSLNLNSGLTLGSNATITGNATVSNGSDAGAACDSASAQAAITHSNTTTISVAGSSNIVGGIQQDADKNSAQLMSHVLNGSTLEELANRANIKFGPMYSRPAFANANGPSSSASMIDYRWGCPAKLVGTCSAEQSSYFPVVAIDAGGGEVNITGVHGQGTLIVRNGDLKIQGNFQFQGIVLVEGILKVYGTPRIEGAVIGMGGEAFIDPGDEALNTGNSVIRFNKCEIVSAQAGLTIGSLDSQSQNFTDPTFAWFEVLR